MQLRAGSISIANMGPFLIGGSIWEDIKMNERDLEKIEKVFKRHIGILSKDVGYKLDVLIKGIQLLAEKMDRMILR